MLCSVYASRRKPDTYLWLGPGHDADRLPASLLDLLDELRLVTEVELTAERSLPREDAIEILASIKRQGWFLQLPADAQADRPTPTDDAGEPLPPASAPRP